MAFKKSQGITNSWRVKQKRQMMRRLSQSDPCVRWPPVAFSALAAPT